MRTLSIRQPWAWLIVNGHKDIENRDWQTGYRGRVLIHAGKTMARSYYDAVAIHIAVQFGDRLRLPDYEQLERGGIVGVATLAGCVSASSSPWWQGPFGFVMTDAKALPFHACNGKLGFFDVQGVQP